MAQVPSTGPVRVAVVEDHPMYRHAVVGALSEGDDVVVRLACGSVEELEARLDEVDVDVVVLDLRLPGVDGAEGVARVVGHGPAVLVLSAQDGRDDVVPAVGAGARGYLTKAAEAPDILAAVRALARGETFLAPGAAAHLVSAVQRPPAPPRPALSSREREVLALVAHGSTDQAIAGRLFIGLTTVRSHLDSIRTKTGRRRRAELTRLAVEEGLVDPPAPPS